MRGLWLSLAALVAVLGLVAGSFYEVTVGTDWAWPFSWLLWAPVGAFILWRRPGNGVGSTLLFIGLAWSLAFIALYLAGSGAPIEIRLWADMLGVVFGVFPWIGIVWLLLVFPSGSPQSRVELWTSRALAAYASFGVFCFAVSPQPMEATGGISPLAVPALEGVSAWLIEGPGFLVIIIFAIVSLVLLVRRWVASGGVERHQYRWLVLGAIVFTVSMASGQLFPEDSSANQIWIIAGWSIPAMIGVAVMRYRLYEIDRIISRTVTYALVVALLGLVFAAGVVIIPNQLMDGEAPPLLVAGSTLAVAALFNPVRRWVQGWVDRRFNRSRYDAERVMNEFAGQLQDDLDIGGILAGWTGVVSETMEPGSMSVWMRRD